MQCIASYYSDVEGDMLENELINYNVRICKCYREFLLTLDSVVIAGLRTGANNYDDKLVDTAKKKSCVLFIIDSERRTPTYHSDYLCFIGKKHFLNKIIASRVNTEFKLYETSIYWDDVGYRLKAYSRWVKLTRSEYCIAQVIANYGPIVLQDIQKHVCTMENRLFAISTIKTNLSKMRAKFVDTYGSDIIQYYKDLGYIISI